MSTPFIHFGRLPFYFWRTPKLTSEQRHQWARLVSELGEDHFLWQFRKWAPNALMPTTQEDRTLSFEQSPVKPRLDSFFTIAQAVIHPTDYLILIGFLALNLVISWLIEDPKSFFFFAKVLVLIWTCWLITLFLSFYRYRRWLRGLVQEYEHRSRH
jgi:hypothetical protein